MAIGDIAMFDALKTSMRWHEERQRVLSANIANSDTPGYMPQDVEAPDFARILAGGGFAGAGLSPTATDAAHLRASTSMAGGFRTVAGTVAEITPDGNGVTIEDQMMQMTQNQLDYELASSLYQRGLGLLRTAIGR